MIRHDSGLACQLLLPNKTQGQIFLCHLGADCAFCMIGLNRLPRLAVPHTASGITFLPSLCFDSISHLAVFPLPWAPPLLHLPSLRCQLGPVI